MNTLPALLLLTALTISSPTLILRSGAHIVTDGSVHVEEGHVVFRTGGVLYSLPTSEVDLEATRLAGTNVTLIRGEDRMRLKVTPEQRDRLLRDLENNHSGTPTRLEPLNVPPTQTEIVAHTEDEWAWRSRARSYEEGVRRAREELELLHNRIDQLQQQIRTFLSLGFKPAQFTYQSSELQVTYDSIPRAELEVERAQRALDQFREDARRQGILPGWLR